MYFYITNVGIGYWINLAESVIVLVEMVSRGRICGFVLLTGPLRLTASSHTRQRGMGILVLLFALVGNGCLKLVAIASRRAFQMRKSVKNWLQTSAGGEPKLVNN
jgi:hypothetical protein